MIKQIQNRKFKIRIIYRYAHLHLENLSAKLEFNLLMSRDVTGRPGSSNLSPIIVIPVGIIILSVIAAGPA